MNKFTLYWTNLDRYEKCPQAFLWYRGWGNIDVGGGPGKKKPAPFQTSRHHAVMGIVIGNVLDKLYNDELWREPNGLEKRLLNMVEREWEWVTAKPYNKVDYRVGGSKQSLIQVCKDGVSGFLRTMKHHRLLGEYAKAEVELLGWVDQYNPVGGRSDLILRRSDTGITILDGKNALSKGKYTDPDQLRWYALLFYLAYGQIPDRLGFTYFRYPYGAPVLDKDKKPVLGEDGEPLVEQGIDWVPFTQDDLKGLAYRAVEARKGMEKEQFAPKAVPSNCKWCDYESVCELRIAQKKANSRKNPKSVDALLDSEGFVDLQF